MALQLYGGLGSGAEQIVGPDSSAGAERPSNQKQRVASALIHAPRRGRCHRYAVRPGDASSAQPLRLQLDSRLDRSLPSHPHELHQVEGLISLEHVVDRPSQLVGQDGQGLGLAVLLLQALPIALSLRVVAQEHDSGFGEGPLQVDVADLGAGGAITLAGRLLGALDEPGVGDEVLDPGEAVDLADLVEDDQGEDLSDPRHRA